MKQTVNKFLLEIEEIYCTECVNITGHIHTGDFWTCSICGNQQGKKKSVFKKFMDEINLTIFRRKNG